MRVRKESRSQLDAEQTNFKTIRYSNVTTQVLVERMVLPTSGISNRYGSIEHVVPFVGNARCPESTESQGGRKKKKRKREIEIEQRVPITYGEYVQ